MTDPQITDATTDETTGSASEELAETALVEEVSIDGMCGVY